MAVHPKCAFILVLTIALVLFSVDITTETDEKNHIELEERDELLVGMHQMLKEYKSEGYSTIKFVLSQFIKDHLDDMEPLQILGLKSETVESEHNYQSCDFHITRKWQACKRACSMFSRAERMRCKFSNWYTYMKACKQRNLEMECYHSMLTTTITPPLLSSITEPETTGTVTTTIPNDTLVTDTTADDATAVYTTAVDTVATDITNIKITALNNSTIADEAIAFNTLTEIVTSGITINGTIITGITQNGTMPTGVTATSTTSDGVTKTTIDRTTSEVTARLEISTTDSTYGWLSWFG